MSKYLAVAAFAGLLLTATSASALPRQPQTTNEATPSTDVAKDVKDAKPERKYCVTDTRPASHIAQRVCKTRTEWMAQGFDPLNP